MKSAYPRVRLNEGLGFTTGIPDLQQFAFELFLVPCPLGKEVSVLVSSYFSRYRLAHLRPPRDLCSIGSLESYQEVPLRYHSAGPQTDASQFRPDRLETVGKRPKQAKELIGQRWRR